MANQMVDAYICRNYFFIGKDKLFRVAVTNARNRPAVFHTPIFTLPQVSTLT